VSDAVEYSVGTLKGEDEIAEKAGSKLACDLNIKQR